MEREPCPGESGILHGLCKGLVERLIRPAVRLRKDELAPALCLATVEHFTGPAV